MVALMKNDEKPSATPCLVLNVSLYLARRSMTFDMSASLKVVRIAAVCWASTSLAAIFWRRPLIRFRVSRGPEVVGIEGVGSEGAGVGAGSGVGAWTWARTS